MARRPQKGDLERPNASAAGSSSSSMGEPAPFAGEGRGLILLTLEGRPRGLPASEVCQRGAAAGVAAAMRRPGRPGWLQLYP